MSHVVVIGCGVVGAAIAYELSQVPGLKITVLDKQPPAQGATGAALGVLMGVISHKIKGNAWQMREASIQRYETLIPELEALTQLKIPFNRQGILMLCFEGQLGDWQRLVEIRRSQGWQLEIWDAAQVLSNCPQLNSEQITAAIYSPQDRQVDPLALTLAMVDAAQRNGVTFHFGVTVEEYYLTTTSTKSVGAVAQLPLLQDADWLVVAAGLGSPQFLKEIQVHCGGIQPPLSESKNSLPCPSIRPVLGQALHIRLAKPLGRADFQPVITGDDVHIVPVGEGDYWVGATVEFSNNEDNFMAAPEKLEAVMKQAIAFCPALANATIIKTWSGLRPRPEGRPAPIIGHLQGFSNVLLATGHYRNGVLLAPATAQGIRRIIAP